MKSSSVDVCAKVVVTLCLTILMTHVHACTMDNDCQLNGVCQASSCVCDQGWTGANCGKLDLDGPAQYAYHPDDATTWGGGPPVKDPTTGKWILFVTEIADHCGLSEWQRMSTVVRASASSPEGPYTREALVIPPQAHNPYYVQDPITKTHLIFHIGGGDNPESSDNPFWHNCTNGTTPNNSDRDTHQLDRTQRPALPTETEPITYSEQPYVHSSSSLTGNFTRINFTLPAGAKSVSYGSDNPAPYIFENGTVLMLSRKYNGTKDAHGNYYKPHDTIWVVRAQSFKGPYELVGPAFPNETFNEEDPCLWRDHRGNFHALFHFTRGHAWSADGLDWHWGGGVAAWEVAFSDGRSIKDTERPRVWINPDSGFPELLFLASGGDSQPTQRGKGEKGFLIVQKLKTAKSSSSFQSH
eukprot:m.28339 g.28339  ORF g.28339 m.28339 type:complete len:412 (-) comp15902_c0_seq1:204-1439(-)